ncbi:MAG: hypothetical protein AAFX78_08790 [Cyanobacteria bacterium J06638_20]
MSIAWRSLQKLLRDNLAGHHPLNVFLKQARELSEDLLARIESLPGAQRNDDCFHYRHRHPKLDYRAVLRKFRTSILSQQRHLTRMKPNRRYGFT